MHAAKHHEQHNDRRQRIPQVQSGLYSIRVNGSSDPYAPSEGIVLQYKRSLGYFTLPGPSKYAVAFPVEWDKASRTVVVEFPPDPNLLPEGGKFRAKGWPRQRHSDAVWSRVAELRNAGHGPEAWSDLLPKRAKVERLPPGTKATLTINEGGKDYSWDVRLEAVIRLAPATDAANDNG